MRLRVFRDLRQPGALRPDRVPACAMTIRQLSHAPPERPMFYYVRRLVETDEDAWDILQEIWIKAFRGLGALRETKRFRIWLYSIAHCTAMSHHCAAYRNQAVLNGAFDPEAAIEADSTIVDELAPHGRASRLALLTLLWLTRNLPNFLQ